MYGEIEIVISRVFCDNHTVDLIPFDVCAWRALIRQVFFVLRR
jgi:hypothetical protein